MGWRKLHAGGRFIPEQLGLDAQTRRAVLRGANLRWILVTRNAAWTIVWVIWLLVTVFGIVGVLNPVTRRTGSAAVVMPFILGMFPLAACWLYIRWQQGRGMARCVYAELRARGHDLCLGCGYLREGIAADTPCPECGFAGPMLRP